MAAGQIFIILTMNTWSCQICCVLVCLW